MDKIYSRPRLFRLNRYTSIGGNNNKSNKYKKIIIYIIIIMIIGYFTAITIIKAITPIIERQCRVVAQSTATRFANEACNSAMQNIRYEDLCTIEKDEEGKIRLIEMNSININKLNSQIALDIQNKLNNNESSKFYIRLGSFTGSKILSGRGPNVEIRMSTIGAVKTNIWNSTDLPEEEERAHEAKVAETIPVQRFADPDEVANVALFLVSDEASYVTGSIYAVDGGQGA